MWVALGLGPCLSSLRPGEAWLHSPSLAGCRVCPGCVLMGFSLSFVPLAVENTTHCEFAYLRDLLIRSVGPCCSPEPALSGWHPGKGESPPGTQLLLRSPPSHLPGAPEGYFCPADPSPAPGLPQCTVPSPKASPSCIVLL